MFISHLTLFIVSLVLVIGFFGYKANRSSNEGHGDYSFDLETPLWILAMIVSIIIIVLIYGGMYWW